MTTPGTTSAETTLLDLHPPAATAARLAATVGDADLDRPTPCQITVRQLLAHLLGLAEAFTDAAAKVDGPTTRTAPAPDSLDLPPDWRARVPGHLDALAAAWRAPEAWTGLAVAGGVEMPAAVMGLVANDELVLHGWDLAVATGQPFAVDPANLEAAWQLVRQTPDDPAAREGLFGPVHPVPADAPLLDRVLGGAGRDPRWSPA
ncbi:TIGR03086 family metal-binding protein [Microlunatus capsulatus]|uniref:Uncharacterized protein (TIGR03086 family) n=1 Tax=Microlunatus capsulatus TaxID=99117 RepID=A0ABS4Z6F1_9ACTN|nr:TIGR03086 family metal-binding protein [Microlunatus capsulatus]MBP2416292.1 uncharacterized protein (TIGR03086 family) [Microlunatus capsulatus]